MTPLEPGHVVAQRYRLRKRLGQGGMGSVWAAEHLVLRAPVAVKVIDPKLLLHATTADEARHRFLLEARAAAALRSPHVVQILDYGVDGETPFIVMEMLEGESLRDRLARERTFAPRDTARLVTQVVRALSRAHEVDVIHRDLKPDNLFLTRNDDEMVVKVLDFGLAKVRAYASSAPKEVGSLSAAAVGDSAASGFTRMGTIVGTPAYMSPEQALGTAIDFRSDLFCLALIAFECMTGRRAFDGDTTNKLCTQICVEPMPVPSRVAQVPAGFDAWFARAAMRDPKQRFQSAREFAEALRATLGPTSEDDGTLAASTRGAPGGARRTSLVSAALVAAVAALVAAGGLFAASRARSSGGTAPSDTASVSAVASVTLGSTPEGPPRGVVGPTAAAAAATPAASDAASGVTAASAAPPPPPTEEPAPPPRRRATPAPAPAGRTPAKKGDPRLGF